MSELLSGTPDFTDGIDWRAKACRLQAECDQLRTVVEAARAFRAAVRIGQPESPPALLLDAALAALDPGPGSEGEDG